MRQFQQVVDRLGVLQIDSVNVLARAHLLPAFSRHRRVRPGAPGPGVRRAHRAGSSRRGRTRRPTCRRRPSGCSAGGSAPTIDQAWGAIAEVPLKHSPLVEEIRAVIAERGPVTARQVQEDFEADHPTTRGEWGWNWSVAKRVLEFLFFTGEITSAGRNGAFERRYDLTSRVLPPAVLALPEPSDEDAVRALTEIGARAHGIGTLRSIADYFRIKEARVAQAIADLVEDGVLHEVVVDGWSKGPVWRHRDADLPRRATGRALLNPFDPLVFERRRLEVAVRSALPHRDLHPRTQARLGLLRAAVPAGGVVAGAGGPQGRPSGGSPAGARRAPGIGLDRAGRRRGRAAGSGAARAGRVARPATTSWSATGTGCCAVTWRRTWRAPSGRHDRRDAAARLRPRRARRRAVGDRWPRRCRARRRRRPAAADRRRLPAARRRGGAARRARGGRRAARAAPGRARWSCSWCETAVLAAVYQAAYFAAVQRAGVAVATLVALGAAPLLVAVGTAVSARRLPSPAHARRARARPGRSGAPRGPVRRGRTGDRGRRAARPRRRRGVRRR